MPGPSKQDEADDPRVAPKRGRISARELSELLGVEESVILEWVQYKEIPYIKRPYSLEFDPLEIGRWLKALIEKDSKKREII